MSRARRLRRQQKIAAAAEAKAKVSARETKVAEVRAAQPPVPHAPWWLAAAFLIPNLGALACRFVFDDRVLLVENDSMHIHSLSQLAHIWKSGYWPDARGLQLYRPVSQTIWALAWAAGGGTHPVLFHALGLAAGVAVVLLLYRFLLAVKTPPRAAFIAALLFALLPIHTDATTSVVGSAELLAAAFSLAALIFYFRASPIPALIFFALAVFSKESAAAFAALPVVFPRKDWRARDSLATGAGAGAIIASALFAHRVLSGSAGVPAIDNPSAYISAGQRILTALWVQCMYLWKAVAPITLSADYSYKQIRLVMGPDDWRAWAGIALAAGAIYLAWRRPEFRAPVFTYAILFSPTANILFPIGTIMGERLIYAPSIGLALLLGILLARTRYWKIVLVGVALVFGARTAVRNRDWLDPRHFYAKLVQTSPNSAKSHYSMGVLLASDGDDPGAIEAYDRAIAIFPAYAEAFRNRGNSFARLGRRDEAMASYRACLRFDPGNFTAASNLAQLQAGIAINPPRAKL
jgi:tetratricopeptide (TPR) repeat protein